MRLVICGLLLSLGCGGVQGTPPVISNLVYSPKTIAVGQATTISGTVDFTDIDGDVDKIAITLSAAGQTQTLPETTVQNTSGVKQGTLNFALEVGTASAGTAQFSVALIDKAGNESNALMGAVTAQ
jgi:hypothetical protein